MPKQAKVNPVEEVAQVFYENVGGAVEPPEAVQDALRKGILWRDLDEDVRAWWIQLARDAVHGISDEEFAAAFAELGGSE